MNPTLTASAQGGKPPKWALYHDFDELKCEVIREAIKSRAITDGEVICGDIKQLAADDVRGFKRCHFFAGGGFWDLALNLAGWGDEPVWTGSCPCPSFSSAGKGGGFDDPRHLWPDWFKLIRECRPPVLFGEQADDAIGYGWLDLVQANMEAEAYAVGAVVFGAHSVGAPHIRQRLYFVADTECGRSQRESIERRGGVLAAVDGTRESRLPVGTRSASAVLSVDTDRESGEWRAGSLPGAQTQGYGERLAVDGRCPVGLDHGQQTLIGSDTENGYRWRGERGEEAGDGQDGERWRVLASDSPTRVGSNSDGRKSSNGDLQRRGENGLFAQDRGTGDCSDSRLSERPRRSRGKESGLRDARSEFASCGAESGVSAGVDLDAYGLGSTAGISESSPWQEGQSDQLDHRSLREHRGAGWLDPQQARSIAETGATRGFWADCDWWYGRDGKYRPIGPGLQPLAHGSPARVGRLRLFGDAIVVSQAQAFIEAYRESRVL